MDFKNTNYVHSTRDLSHIKGQTRATSKRMKKTYAISIITKRDLGQLY